MRPFSSMKSTEGQVGFISQARSGSEEKPKYLSWAQYPPCPDTISSSSGIPNADFNKDQPARLIGTFSKGPRPLACTTNRDAFALPNSLSTFVSVTAGTHPQDPITLSKIKSGSDSDDVVKSIKAEAVKISKS